MLHTHVISRHYLYCNVVMRNGAHDLHRDLSPLGRTTLELQIRQSTQILDKAHF